LQWKSIQRGFTDNVFVAFHLRIGGIKMAKYSAIDIADYLLSLENDVEAGEVLSHLKLQKLLYYAQGFHLALYDEPLFDEKIEAWTHGPVCYDVYQKYKKYRSGRIPPQGSINLEKYDNRVKELLNEIHSVFGQFSAWKLRNMTHGERPWRQAWERNQAGYEEITHEELKEYFKTQLVHDDN